MNARSTGLDKRGMRVRERDSGWASEARRLEEQAVALMGYRKRWLDEDRHAGHRTRWLRSAELYRRVVDGAREGLAEAKAALPRVERARWLFDRLGAEYFQFADRSAYKWSRKEGHVLEYQDAKQEARWAVLNAARNWNPGRGVLFATFLKARIRPRLQQAEMRAQGQPPNGWRKLAAVLEAESRHIRENGVRPTVQELMAATGLTEDVVGRIMAKRLTLFKDESVHNSEPYQGDGQQQRYWTALATKDPPADEALDTARDLDRAERALEELREANPRLAEIVEETVLAGRSNVALGAEMGLSRERVRQLRQDGLKALRFFAGAGGDE